MAAESLCVAAGEQHEREWNGGQSGPSGENFTPYAPQLQHHSGIEL